MLSAENFQKEQINSLNYNFPLMSTAVIIAFTFFLVWVILFYQASQICLTWILAKYEVILRVVGMNCTRGGALLERVKTTALRLLKKKSLLPFKITPLLIRSAHTLIVSNCCCHERSISEPAAIKIMWLRQARARYYCWWASFGPRAACCRPLPYTLLLSFSSQSSSFIDLFTRLKVLPQLCLFPLVRIVLSVMNEGWICHI